MNSDKLKNYLEEIVHCNLYISNELSFELQEKWNEIINYFKNCNNIFDDLKMMLIGRTNDNYYVYDKYLEDILCVTNLDTKLDILNNASKYNDIFKDDNIFISIYKSLDNNERINYLINKKKYTDSDIGIINYFLEDEDFCKTLFKKITSEEIRTKITPYSIKIVTSNINYRKIDFSNYELCSIFTKESYTTLLLKKCKTFDDFLDVYNKDNRIYNLIANNCLKFSSKDNEKIYTFIMDNPNFIGKFDDKYLDLFNIIEIKSFLKIKSLDSDAYSTIISKMFKYDNTNADELFNVVSLKKCSKHSIKVYPFDYLSDDVRNSIFNDYILFSKFIDVAMIEAINKYFTEDDILNILRTDSFVEETSSYAIELLLNKLSFKSAFNMLQRKGILDKIYNLNVKIDERDGIFIKGFLDSPVLVYKSDHTLINEMLGYLNDDDVNYYLALPYIINALSIYEIINICLSKRININNVINNEIIRNKFNVSDLIDYIDKYWEFSLDLSIFMNKKLVTQLFNIPDDIVNNIDFDEVNYLYETIRMKSILSKQDVKCDISSYKAVLLSYLVLGLDKTLDLVSIGNSHITLNELKKRQKDIVNEKVKKYKIMNALVFQDINNKVIYELDLLSKYKNKDDFIKNLKDNTYLNNIVYLMLDCKYDTYSNIINRFFSYVAYSESNKYYAKKDINVYIDKYVQKFINDKKIQYNIEFDKKILDNFKLKEKIVYKKRKELSKEFVLNTELKIFVRSLTEPDKEKYREYFDESYSFENDKDNYIGYLKNDIQDFNSILEHILLPLVNKRFDKENCLNKLGYVKPLNYDKYIKYKENLADIMKINIKLDSYKEEYIKEEMIDIMNYICYGTDIDYPIANNVLKKLDSLRDIINNIDGEVYVDKTADKLIYSNNLDIYNIDEIIEYNNYIDIIDKIIKKTYRYISKWMIDEVVINNYTQEYYDYINNDNSVYPITSEYYELKRRVLCLNDIRLMYKGYDIKSIKKADNSLLDFISDYIFYYLDGYYDGLLDNFGLIISLWDKIESYIKEWNINEKINIVDLDMILNNISFEDNVFAKLIDKDIINGIMDDSYYLVDKFDDKINILVDVYKNSLKKVSSSVPYISYKEDNYEVKVIDNYSNDAFYVFPGSLYRIGTIGNDLLAYSLINKNGCQIGIYKDSNLIDKVIGVRNGNVLYLNIIEGLSDDNIMRLLKTFGNVLINSMKDEKESIQLVTIVNNDLFSDTSGCVVDTTICPIISYPISIKYNDYKRFINSSYIIGKRKNIYSNYDDNYVSLLANNVVVDKSNFKIYDPESKYLRKRNDVIKLSNNIEDVYRKKIDLIIALCEEDNKEEGQYIDYDVNYDYIKTIYLGDDYVIFVNEDNVNIIYQLKYDKRSDLEIDAIIKATSK